MKTIRERLNGIPPSPWHHFVTTDDKRIIEAVNGTPIAIQLTKSVPTAVFICHAAEDIRTLLGRVEELETELRCARQSLDDLAKRYTNKRDCLNTIWGVLKDR